MRFAGECGLKDGYGVFELTDSVTHLGDLLMEFFGICQDETR